MEDQQFLQYNEINDRWVDLDTLFRDNPWGSQGIENPALKMAFMACFNIDTFKTFIFESTFLSRFDVPQDRLQRLIESDEALLMFGFDWIKFFLAGTGPLALKK